MIQKVVIVFFCLLCIPKGFSQVEIPEFSHVIVPEQFNFLKGKDTYQLNSLTKFLLNKNGFKTVFENELTNVDRCDALYADLETVNGIIYTKMVLVLKNCYGDEVARSNEGKSKFKDYKKAYQESVRNALENFKANQFETIPRQSKEVALPPSPKEVVDHVVVSNSAPASSKVVPKQVAVKQVTVPDPVENALPKRNAFTFESYTITPTAAGDIQMLYNNALIGNLIPTSVSNVYLVRTSMFYGVAKSTPYGFIVEREVEGMNSLLTMKFQ